MPKNKKSVGPIMKSTCVLIPLSVASSGLILSACAPAQSVPSQATVPPNPC